jgi:predicted O-methyltransferase YrrM
MPALARRLGSELRYAYRLRRLPLPVARFLWRARRVARRTDDQFSLVSPTRPEDLARLLGLADGRREVVELGTGTAWTTIALALADPARRLVSYDPCERSQRERYLALVSPRIRERIRLVVGPGADGPHEREGAVDLLYIDSGHGRDETIAEWRTWRPSLRAGSLVVFDDYSHPQFPGVREAVAELGLSGRAVGGLFVHEVGQAGRREPS